MAQTVSIENVIIKTIQKDLPLILLLGQDAWSGKENSDPVLTQALRYLGRDGEDINGWPSLICKESLKENFYQWLAERFSRRVLPEWMKTILSFPWNAIFTSSLDPSLHSALTASGRSPQVVLTGDEIPPVLRSRTRIPLYYLFGRAGDDDQKSMPPSTLQGLRTRRNVHAIPMLNNRLVETATAIGTVIIEGFNPEKDWITVDSVLTIIDQMPGSQVIWFGWKGNQDIDELQEIEELSKKGKVLLTKARLSSFIAELNASGKFDEKTQYISGERGNITFYNDNSFSPPPEIKIRVESVSSIVDDSWTTFLAPLGDDALYSAFRQFHGDVVGPKALVEGIQRGNFAIVRDFESDLWELVNNASKDHERFNEPIIVHGQSGTGKSIALARLVYRLRDKDNNEGERRSAVLYSVARIPQSTDISDFCELAERSGAASTVIICDSNAHICQYRELLRQLRSRGRKIVVVGSSYRQIDAAAQAFKSLVEAQNILSDQERVDFAQLISDFGVPVSPEHIPSSSTILATIYRLLPVSRTKFTAGLGKEAQVVEKEIRARGSAKQKRKAISPLAKQLIDAGLAEESTALLDQCIENELRNIEDSAGRLIDFVMAPGRINCPVPINLLLRAISSNQEQIDYNTIKLMFEGIDLFRWQQKHKDEEFLVSPRLKLEAELICRRRMGSPEAEGERLIELMKAVRLSWDAGGTERRFLIELIQGVGPDGPLNDYYKTSYLPAAKALTELRNRYSITVDPRILLQESVLRRTAIRLNQADENKQYQLLEEAREAIQLAIDHVYKNRSFGSQRMMHNLMVERASIYGFLARNCLKNGGTKEEIWSAYNAARTVAQAAANSIDTYYPLDISLWVPADLLEADSLTEEQQAELRADIHSTLDRIDSANLEYEQKDQFEKRRWKLGKLLDLPELTEEAFIELEKIGSTAGYFLRARSLGPEVGYQSSDKPTGEDVKKAENVISFLERYWDKINNDVRCLRYLLQCRWIFATHTHLLRRDERAPLPFDLEGKNEMLSNVQSIIQASGENCDYTFRYLEAVITWLISDENHAKSLWRNLSTDTDNSDSRRVYRRNILTDSEGTALKFSGRIEREQAEGRVVVKVNEITRRIYMMKSDFPDIDLSYGRTVDNFHIAFNYIGPIADSPKRVGRKS